MKEVARRFFCLLGMIVSFGCGSKLKTRGYAGFGPCFHLPGFHFGTGFLSQPFEHSYASRCVTIERRAVGLTGRTQRR